MADEVPKEIADALDTLKGELAQARARFHEAGDGGREGALGSLQALLHFVDRFNDHEIRDLLQPVYVLGLALTQVSNGVRTPMLTAPPRTGGRPPDNREWNAAKALVALAVTILVDAEEPESKARAFVARVLTNAGSTQFGGAPITAKTVRSWRQEAMQGYALTKGTVAAFYRDYQAFRTPPAGVPARTHADRIIAFITLQISTHLRV